MRHFFLVLILATLTAPIAIAADSATLQQSATAAYLRADGIALQSLATDVQAWRTTGDRDERYTAAYVAFRQTQLAAVAEDKQRLRTSGEQCVAASAAAIQTDERYAEAHALQAACYGYLATLGGFGAISSGRKSGKAMDVALALAPRNPRVILIDALGLAFRPRFVGGDKTKAYQRCREAASVFDASRATVATPDWGAPESWYWVGRGAENAGDATAARQAYERALALANDFAAARRRLATLTH
ncbi:MAG: tetratricopeptide repeat protein [Pseudomonadales bacterium]|nr:tetratricopeptide repeat protein [Pseudomonadales bacterium]